MKRPSTNQMLALKKIAHSGGRLVKRRVKSLSGHHIYGWMASDENVHGHVVRSLETKGLIEPSDDNEYQLSDKGRQVIS